MAIISAISALEKSKLTEETKLSLKASPFLIEIKSFFMQPLFVKNGLTKFQKFLFEEITFSVLV